MKLRKIELKLEGDQYWPKVSIVHVRGNPSAKHMPDGATQPEGEQVVRTWEQAAVMRVTPADGKALVGFWASPEHCQ